eukprot:gene12108-biopygen544
MTLILVIPLCNAGTDSDDTAVVNNCGVNIDDNKNVFDENNYDDDADDTYEWYNNADNNNTGDSDVVDNAGSIDGDHETILMVIMMIIMLTVMMLMMTLIWMIMSDGL